ncbi:hypothetical protein C8R45DRAFT_1205348 [Mycena sanguinolenta]|nr:hypothetical protein C8R45DRAFT_1205348 [Mycena sanguinolenta]
MENGPPVQPSPNARRIPQFRPLVPVKRDSLWYLPRSPWITYQDILVRLEYHRLMKGILRWNRLRTMVAPDTSDTDPFGPNPEMRRIEALGPEDELSSALEYPNPFIDQLDAFRRHTILVLTGLPGIGKTSFLGLVFHLRVAATLPTLYMVDEHHAVVFVQGKTWLVPAAELSYVFQKDWVPEGTWCLVECYSGFRGIPRAFVKGRRFLLVAASPQNSSTLSVKDFMTAQYCVMRPWSLQELLDGLQFQDLYSAERPAPADLENFFKRYGGSARLAYQKSADRFEVSKFEARITNAVNLLGSDNLKPFIRSLFTTMDIDAFSSSRLAGLHDILHTLLSVFPLDDVDRTRLCVGAPSESMALRAVEILAPNLATARDEFRLLSEVQSPTARGWTLTLCNKFYHDSIKAGGVWRLQRMHQTSQGPGLNDIWWTEVHDDPSPLYLVADSKLSIVPGVRFIAWPERVPSRPLRREQEPMITPGDHIYYIPEQTSNPIFDSFYIDKSHHALGFQTMTTLDGPRIKLPSVEWLKAYEVKEITYILVTPDKLKGERRVEMPRVLGEGFSLDAVYHLPIWS